MSEYEKKFRISSVCNISLVWKITNTPDTSWVTHIAILTLLTVLSPWNLVPNQPIPPNHKQECMSPVLFPSIETKHLPSITTLLYLAEFVITFINRLKKQTNLISHPLGVSTRTCLIHSSYFTEHVKYLISGDIWFSEICNGVEMVYCLHHKIQNIINLADIFQPRSRSHGRSLTIPQFLHLHFWCCWAISLRKVMTPRITFNVFLLTPNTPKNSSLFPQFPPRNLFHSPNFSISIPEVLTLWQKQNAWNTIIVYSHSKWMIFQ